MNKTKKLFRQVLIFLTIALLIVLPTAIITLPNLGNIASNAFSKELKQEDALFAISSVSSENTQKDSPFTITATVLSPETYKLQYVAVAVEFNNEYVDITGIDLEEGSSLKAVKTPSSYLIIPDASILPKTIDEVSPTFCLANKTCDLTALSTQKISFRINGVLKNDLSKSQRPVKISVWGVSEDLTSTLWNKQILSPELKVAKTINNSLPQFVTEPQISTSIGKPYIYTIEAKDTDNDTITYSLRCPATVFCENLPENPTDLKLENNVLTWESPRENSKPYIITVYASDGKDVSTQTFALRVIDTDAESFSCVFTPAVAVKVFDTNRDTPFILQTSLPSGISSIAIRFLNNATLEETLNFSFANSPTEIFLDENSTPSLKYRFKEGDYDVQAYVTGVNGRTYSCILENRYSQNILEKIIRYVSDLLIKPVLAVTAGQNVAPTFTTNPSSSTPGLSFTVGTNYRYALVAQDANGDPLQYRVVTKPDWATVSQTQNSGGQLGLTISGTPTNGGANMFSIRVNDGYGNYVAQTWIVNVNYSNNDIPVITLSDPTRAITRAQGQKVTLAWTATDRNQIIKYDLYSTREPGGSLSALRTNIDYRTQSLIVDTASLSPGDYYFVLQATDNQSPAAVGQVITPLIKIVPKVGGSTPVPTTPAPTTPIPTTVQPTETSSPTPTISPTTTVTDTPTPTDTIEPTPEANDVSISFIQPKEDDKIPSSDFKIVARIQASPNSTLRSTDIKVFVDDQDISSKVRFSTEEGASLSLTYEPATLLTVGSHSLKITATDSNSKNGERTITFSITALTIDDPTEETTEILGFIIPNSVRNIIFIGIAILLVALLLPLMLYFSWRSSRKNTYMPQPATPMPQAPQPFRPSPPTARPMPFQSPTPQPPMGPQIPKTPSIPSQPVPMAPKPVYQPENAGITNPIVTQRPQPQPAAPIPQSPVAQPATPIQKSHSIPSFVQPRPTAPAGNNPVSGPPVQPPKPTQFGEIKGPATIPQKANTPLSATTVPPKPQ